MSVKFWPYEKNICEWVLMLKCVSRITMVTYKKVPNALLSPHPKIAVEIPLSFCLDRSQNAWKKKTERNDDTEDIFKQWWNPICIVTIQILCVALKHIVMWNTVRLLYICEPRELCDEGSLATMKIEKVYLFKRY